jgi:hypothetical protein
MAVLDSIAFPRHWLFILYTGPFVGPPFSRNFPLSGGPKIHLSLAQFRPPFCFNLFSRLPKSMQRVTRKYKSNRTSDRVFLDSWSTLGTNMSPPFLGGSNTCSHYCAEKTTKLWKFRNRSGENNDDEIQPFFFASDLDQRTLGWGQHRLKMVFEIVQKSWRPKCWPRYPIKTAPNINRKSYNLVHKLSYFGSLCWRRGIIFLASGWIPSRYNGGHILANVKPNTQHGPPYHSKIKPDKYS